MSKQTNLVIHLRWVKGKQLSYDGQGELQNENGLTKLRYGTLGWVNYLKRLKTHGFCEVTAVAAFDGKSYEELEVPEEIALEVVNAIKEADVVLTAEQQRIADLEAKLEALINKDKPVKKVKEVKSSENFNEAFEEAVKEEKPAQQKRGRKPQSKKKD